MKNMIFFILILLPCQVISINLTFAVRNPQPTSLISQNFPDKLTLSYQNLSGVELRVTTVEEFPFADTFKNAEGKLEGRGAAFKVLDILAEKHKFTYKIIPPALNYFFHTNKSASTAFELLESGVR